MLVVFDSHPVQYRVPIWQTMEAKVPQCLHVVYATDCSVKGHADTGFGQVIAWDEPLLSGYQYTILHSEKGKPLSGWGSLTGKGVKEIFDTLQPTAILLTGFNYQYDLIAYFHAFKRGIPVWLRCETQDEANTRSFIKSSARSLIYKLLYSKISKFFYIGELNKSHYLKYGVSHHQLFPARYATVDRFTSLNDQQKIERRINSRIKAGITDTHFVVGFSGKFISKKNPEILFQMIEFLPNEIRSNLFLYFLGSGELETKLIEAANLVQEKYGIKTNFAGFVNQTQLVDHYLAMDLLILPSQRMGETWGLVVNEAMQAGCSVIVSNAVGSSADFKNWEQFRVFREGDVKELADRVINLYSYPRSFHWAKDHLDIYSIEANAEVFLNMLNFEHITR